MKDLIKKLGVLVESWQVVDPTLPIEVGKLVQAGPTTHAMFEYYVIGMAGDRVAVVPAAPGLDGDDIEVWALGKRVKIQKVSPVRVLSGIAAKATKIGVRARRVKKDTDGKPFAAEIVVGPVTIAPVVPDVEVDEEAIKAKLKDWGSKLKSVVDAKLGVASTIDHAWFTLKPSYSEYGTVRVRFNPKLGFDPDDVTGGKEGKLFADRLAAKANMISSVKLSFVKEYGADRLIARIELVPAGEEYNDADTKFVEPVGEEWSVSGMDKAVDVVLSQLKGAKVLEFDMKKQTEATKRFFEMKVKAREATHTASWMFRQIGAEDAKATVSFEESGDSLRVTQVHAAKMYSSDGTVSDAVLTLKADLKVVQIGTTVGFVRAGVPVSWEFKIGKDIVTGNYPFRTERYGSDVEPPFTAAGTGIRYEVGLLTTDVSEEIVGKVHDSRITAVEPDLAEVVDEIAKIGKTTLKRGDVGFPKWTNAMLVTLLPAKYPEEVVRKTVGPMLKSLGLYAEGAGSWSSAEHSDYVKFTPSIATVSGDEMYGQTFASLDQNVEHENVDFKKQIVVRVFGAAGAVRVSKDDYADRPGFEDSNAWVAIAVHQMA